jgi:transposase
MKFTEITDEQWVQMESFLPSPAKTGRPRADDRKTVDGIIYILTTGCRWMDMPKQYGSYVTAWRRLRRWEEEGVWTKLLQSLVSRAYSIGKLDMKEVSIDSTTIDAKKGGRWLASMATGGGRVQRFMQRRHAKGSH